MVNTYQHINYISLVEKTVETKTKQGMKFKVMGKMLPGEMGRDI